MTKGNIIDFATYVEDHTDKEEQIIANANDELGRAIELLILRLKEANPIDGICAGEKY